MLPVFQLPVPFPPPLALAVPAAAAGFQLLNTIKYPAARSPSRAHEDDFSHAFPIQLRFHRGISQDGFDFRGKKQTAIMELIKKRLYPHPVPGQKQPSVLFLPDRKGEDSVESVYAIRPEFRIGMEHHLCVGVSGKLVPGSYQFLPQFLGVIQLSIVYQGIILPAPVQRHWLFASLGIDDCQSGMQQRCIRCAVSAGTIRSPPLHRFQDVLQGFFVIV